MKRLLFVCMGNICRSPVAEGLMRDKLIKLDLVEGKDFTIDSAGTISDWQGSQPDTRSQAVMSSRGIDISDQASRPLTKDDGDKFDLLLCMDARNLADAKNIIAEENHDKIRLLDDSSVADPYISTAEGFEAMYQHLDKATDQLASELFG